MSKVYYQRTTRHAFFRSSIYTGSGPLGSGYGVAHLLMQGQISDKGERLYDEQDVHSLVIDFILSGTFDDVHKRQFSRV